MVWAPNYLELAEMRAYHRIVGTLDDAQIGLAIATASRIVDHVTSRQFGNTEERTTRTYRTDQISFSQTFGKWRIRIDDVHDLTNLELRLGSASSDPITGDQLELDPPNAVDENRPVERIFVHRMNFGNAGRPGPAFVTAESFGWAEIPLTVQQATALQTARLIRRREAPFGIAGSPDQGGNEVRLLAMADPDVVVALKPYRRDWPRI